ncbi:hypothetical protein pdam_00017045 [Pocillopora damicornis]|uniref:G-protein coupled receptors family 1 profile domain-containing protein n=1 Tax=Pocillopora damicornis TaxID=46731 RepID=A0A3M6TQX3_POCDA|nr:hypothetical protein pdam_00017045 [Pocillopora damicornis]
MNEKMNHLKMTNTSSSTCASVSRRNDTNDAYDGTQGEGIALCSALTLTLILVVVGNLLTIVIFAKNKNICKKYLLLVVNMAFADLFLGALSLPVYIYDVGIAEFRRALALCCRGRHVQAAVNTKLSKRGKERHRTTAEFNRKVAFEQNVLDTNL